MCHCLAGTPDVVRPSVQRAMRQASWLSLAPGKRRGAECSAAALAWQASQASNSYLVSFICCPLLQSAEERDAMQLRAAEEVQPWLTLSG